MALDRLLRKSSLLFETVRHLKPTQVYHQVLYRLKKTKRLIGYDNSFDKNKITPLNFSVLPPVFKTALSKDQFEFLNIKHSFVGTIDWNYQGYGKLWNYNLQYANYILQEELSIEVRKEWMRDMYQWLSNGRLPLEPYPVSLRSINAIRFASKHNLMDVDILGNVHAELDFLSQRPEYHLLANHLLENGFALIMGGAYFDSSNWIKQAENILTSQLKEQILNDGGHFELSPMYHQIILFRLLELIDWYSKWDEKKQEFLSFLRIKAEAMIAWLRNMTFSNGDIPHFNDSANDVAYSSDWLIEYAKTLEINTNKQISLEDSGYRVFAGKSYECKIDAGEVGPSYQPGHAHADALSFVLYANGNPVIVDTGTSTYQIGELRSLERSTPAHNTVALNEINQSQVWGGFRVGRRALVNILVEKKDNLSAQVAYKVDGTEIHHKRSFIFDNDQIFIVDEIDADKIAKAYFHFHPECSFKNIDNKTIEVNSSLQITFDKNESMEWKEYDYAEAFNKRVSSKVLIVSFRRSLTTKIFE